MQNNSFPPEMSKNYKHFDDPRGEWEIQLTNRLALALSQVNLNTLSTPPQQGQRKGLKKEDFLYVCINGIPPFENEFAFLQLPGQTLHFWAPCFRKGISSQQLMQMPSDFAGVAQLMHQEINKASKDKPIVFIYHSFGTFIFAQYCHMFKNDRIIGIIDAGGAPIRFYPLVKGFVRDTSIPIEYVTQNIDALFQATNEHQKKMGMKLYTNKQELLGVFYMYQSQPGFKEMFEYIRNIPNVLKCFIYGKKDAQFLDLYLHEKAIFFTYKNKFEPTYDALLQKAYQRCWGKKCDNVQEKFVYCIEDGYHSLHMQRKLKGVNSAIVKRYLTFLEELHASDEPKL